ncbi:GIY-YIG nuclease family protein [Eubacteriaceae bacterium ES2]|nr:GIY-YIG nuclease family protein [Eubacteriaceae bacterium ES2]
MDKAYVYIVKCSDKSFYTGYTNDLKGRLLKHNQGSGAKYTRGRRPVELVYFEELPGKSEALSREFAIKKMKRSQKQKLIETADQNELIEEIVGKE